MSQQSPSNSSTTSLIPDSLARMLQQHLHNNNQNSPQQTSTAETTPHHKAFVCEICGKAFRFRSNLAEHRSVHTAVKPFVCKFCGKSSRLKGNLTKHILKHHKTEQREHIGTDEYIIKKGKKSVKDPAAIEFLEQSMIVLNNSRGGAKTNQADEGRHQNGHDDSQEGGGVHNVLLSQLGLDASNMDFQMKEEGSISDGVDNEGGGGMMDFDGLSNNNERLLENCENAIGMDGSEEGEDEEEEEGNSQQCSGEQSPKQQQQIGPSFGGLNNGTNALAAAACKAIFGQFDAKHLMAKAMLGMGTMMKSEAQNQPQNGESGNEEMLKLLAAFGNGQSKQCEGEENGEEEKQPTQQLVMPNASGGFRLAATQCQFCAKHFRKPRDLIAHQSNAHKTMANNNSNNNNNANIACQSPASSSAHPDDNDFGRTQKSGNENGNGGSQNEAMLQELRELREQLTGMRQQIGMGKLEQMISQLDSRVCRLEKQLEMALNSIYTLVQLQTGINNSVNKLSRSVLK